MKLLAFDVETSGLWPNKHAILQFGGIIADIDGEEIDRIELKIQPFERDVVDERALAVNQFKIDDLYKEPFLSPAEAFKQLITFLEKHVSPYHRQDKLMPLGYNCHSFDCQFLREFFKKNNNKFYGSYFWNPPIDIMLLWTYRFMFKRPTMIDFKLGTVAQAAGIELDPTRLHDAIYDVELTLELYRRLNDEKANV